MDKDAIKLLATIGALKLLVGRLGSLVYTSLKLTPAQIEQMHSAMLEGLPKQTLVNTNAPATSDLLSAEIEVEMRSLLKGIEQDLGMAPNQGG